jgi:hypothetical protein
MLPQQCPITPTRLLTALLNLARSQTTSSLAALCFPWRKTQWLARSTQSAAASFYATSLAAWKITLVPTSVYIPWPQHGCRLPPCSNALGGRTAPLAWLALASRLASRIPRPPFMSCVTPSLCALPAPSQRPWPPLRPGIQHLVARGAAEK